MMIWVCILYWILKLFTIFMMIIWVGVGISATSSNCEELTPSTGRFMIACWTSSFMSLKHTCRCCWLYHNFWLIESVASSRYYLKWNNTIMFISSCGYGQSTYTFKAQGDNKMTKFEFYHSVVSIQFWSIPILCLSENRIPPGPMIHHFLPSYLMDIPHFQTHQHIMLLLISHCIPPKSS